MTPHPRELRAFLDLACRLLDERGKVPIWRSWRRPLGVAPAAGLLVVCGCGGSTTSPDPVACEDETCPDQCEDGLDNDGDGSVDCADPGCADVCSQPEYGMPLLEDCENGVDDDGDELVDCADPDCADSCAGPVYGIPITNEIDCTNGVDDDGDELVDCADPDCALDCVAQPIYAAPLG